MYTCVCAQACVCVCTRAHRRTSWPLGAYVGGPLAARCRISEDSDLRHLADVGIKKEDLYYWPDQIRTNFFGPKMVRSEIFKMLFRCVPITESWYEFGPVPWNDVVVLWESDHIFHQINITKKSGPRTNYGPTLLVRNWSGPIRRQHFIFKNIKMFSIKSMSRKKPGPRTEYGPITDQNTNHVPDQTFRTKISYHGPGQIKYGPNLRTTDRTGPIFYWRSAHPWSLRSNRYSIVSIKIERIKRHTLIWFNLRPSVTV